MLTRCLELFAVVRDVLLAALAVLLALPRWCRPWRVAAAFGRAYGMTLGAIWPLARRVAAINLARAYPGVSRAEARRTTWACLASLGQGVAEGLQFARRFRNGSDGWRDLIEIEDRDLERRILDDPRPKIFVTAHLGSWEVAMAIAGLRAGERGAAIVRRIDNGFLDAIVRRVRARRQSQWIDKAGASAAALGRLRRGDSVAL